MKLFVGPLPEAVNQRDVRSFVESAIHPRGPLGLFKKSNMPVICTMMESRGGSGSAPIYFAVVQVHPESRARRAIAVLDGTVIHGKKVNVRPYIERNPANDRRLGNAADRLVDRRTRERRGYAVFRVTNTASMAAAGMKRKVVVSPVKGFAREYRS